MVRGRRPAVVQLVRGAAAGTTMTGTLYEPGERPPTFAGAPDEGAPYVWVCDECYAVESGGAVQRLDGRAVRVAFDPPLARGFETRERALAAAVDHLRTQFARLGVPEADVEIQVEPVEDGRPP